MFGVVYSVAGERCAYEVHPALHPQVNRVRTRHHATKSGPSPFGGFFIGPNMTESLYQQLVRHEGIRLKPYHCTAGKLTIGVGRNLDDKGITNGEAMVLLHNDVDEVANWLRADYPWFEDLSMARRNALINMGFNLGRAGLGKFKNTLAAIQSGEWDKAAAGMLNSKWAKQVGKRASELAEQMRLG